MTMEMSLFMALLNPINLNINKNESVILQRPNEMMMIATIMRNKNGEINTIQIITHPNMKCKNNLVIVARMPPKHVISHGNNVKFITHYYSLRIIDNLSDFFFRQQLFLFMGELHSFEAVHCMFHLLAVINIFVELFLFSAINELDKTFFSGRQYALFM